VEDALFILGSLACIGSLGLFVGVFTMSWLALFIPVTTWRQMRTRSRPVLWMLGLDWPEIKWTFKRSFMICYASSLPESRQLASPESSLPGDALDESGGIPPAASPATSPVTEPE
jgi:hypothetical protein